MLICLVPNWFANHKKQLNCYISLTFVDFYSISGQEHSCTLF